ncbi:hypothetical protein [Salicola sp. Rm-C-2C1-2]|uniref:hypothetical protein n=1 Tax=Salicola sp. Rm-C-2C1-2 TaxID=3141321 RepID=UPI0032E410FB
MQARLFTLIAASLSLALAACDSGGPSVSDKNSFGIGDTPDFRDEGSGDRCQSTRNLDDNQLLVSVQTPSNGPDAGKASGLSSTTRAELRLVEIASQWSQSLSTETVDDGFVVTFDNAIPRRIDIAIEASVAGSTFRAPVASECGHVFVNPFSEVLIDEVASDLVKNTNVVSEINRCNDVDCTYDLVWQPVADQVHSFEIDVTEGESALRERADFMTFLEKAEALLTQEAATLDKTDGNNDGDNIAPGYNAVQYSVSLNTGDNGGFWATHTLDRGVSQTNGTAYTYPSYSIGNLSLSELGFDLALGTADMPFQRRSFDSPLDDAFRSYSTQANQLFAPEDDGNGDPRTLSSLRPVLQTVSDQGSRTIGWAPNPQVYRAGAQRAPNQPPEAMLSSHFFAARGWALSGTEETGYDRDQILEEQAISSIELNLSEWEGEDDFTPADFNADYQFAGFEVKPASNGGVDIARASLGTWEFTGNEQGTEKKTSAWALNGSTTYPYSGFELLPVPQLETPDDGNREFLGNLFINYGSQNQRGNADEGIPNGAVSADERWIATSSRPTSEGAEAGSLLRVAYRQDAQDTLPASNTAYRLQGVTITGSDSLIQHQNACIETNQESAAFELSGHKTDYSTDSDTLGIADATSESGEGCTLSPGSDRATFTINSCGSSKRAFKGFAANDGDTLVMITQSNEKVGFLLGFRDDSAAGCAN